MIQYNYSEGNTSLNKRKEENKMYVVNMRKNRTDKLETMGFYPNLQEAKQAKEEMKTQYKPYEIWFAIRLGK